MVKYRPWSRAFAWNLCSQHFADETCLVLRAYLWCQRSLSASGCMEVGQRQDSRAREQSTECCRDMWSLLLLEELMYSCRSKNRCPSEQLRVRSHLLAEFLAKAQLLVVGFLAAVCLYQ